MSHIRTSTKMGFPENQTKMIQLRDHRTSPKMVVRGWYMTHFDRTDLLNSQKTGLGWFPQLARPLRADLRIFSIFSEISVWNTDPQKPIFLSFESEKNVRKLFFSKIFWFSKNYAISAPEWSSGKGAAPPSPREFLPYNYGLRPLKFKSLIFKTLKRFYFFECV